MADQQQVPTTTDRETARHKRETLRLQEERERNRREREERQLAELGIVDLGWTNDDYYLEFDVVASKLESVPNQKIVDFCIAETEKKSLERIDDPSTARTFKFEVKVNSEYSGPTKFSYDQWFRHRGIMYAVAGATVVVDQAPDGTRTVDAHILPSTCEIVFPSDDWFENATRVWVTTAPTYGDPGKFRMQFYKYAMGANGEGPVMYDSADKVVDRGSC